MAQKNDRCPFQQPPAAQQPQLLPEGLNKGGFSPYNNNFKPGTSAGCHRQHLQSRHKQLL